jgi:hypothetical protein
MGFLVIRKRLKKNGDKELVRSAEFYEAYTPKVKEIYHEIKEGRGEDVEVIPMGQSAWNLILKQEILQGAYLRGERNALWLKGTDRRNWRLRMFKGNGVAGFDELRYDRIEKGELVYGNKDKKVAKFSIPKLKTGEVVALGRAKYNVERVEKSGYILLRNPLNREKKRLKWSTIKNGIEKGEICRIV